MDTIQSHAEYCRHTTKFRPHGHNSANVLIQPNVLSSKCTPTLVMSNSFVICRMRFDQTPHLKMGDLYAPYHPMISKACISGSCCSSQQGFLVVTIHSCATSTHVLSLSWILMPLDAGYVSLVNLSSMDHVCSRPDRSIWSLSGCPGGRWGGDTSR